MADQGSSTTVAKTDQMVDQGSSSTAAKTEQMANQGSSSTAAKIKRMRAGIPCPFCGVPQQNFLRHVHRQHADQPPVEKIIQKSLEIGNIKERSAYRRQAFRLLAHEGRAAHNEKILKDPTKNTSHLAPVRRMKSGVTRFYKECPYCKNIFRRVSRHKCVRKRYDVRNIAGLARQVVPATSLTPIVNISRVLTEILASIHNDPVKNVILQDKLMLSWADVEVRKHMTVVDFSSTDDEEETVENRRARRRRRREIYESVTYKLANESRCMLLRKQLRLLSRYVLQYRKKFKSAALTLADTFHSEYVNYASQAIKRLTVDFMKVEQAKKLCTWLGKLWRGFGSYYWIW